MKTQKLTELALLSTVALIIFVIELKISNLVPVPGVKLGLSNIITVYAVYHYSAKETYAEHKGIRNAMCNDTARFQIQKYFMNQDHILTKLKQSYAMMYMFNQKKQRGGGKMRRNPLKKGADVMKTDSNEIQVNYNSAISRSLHLTRLSGAGNILLALFKIISGVLALSVSTCVNGFYTLGMVLARYCALTGVVRTKEVSEQYRYYRWSGIVLISASCLYIACSIRMYFHPDYAVYHPYIAMGIATVTFVEIGLNLRGVLVFRKNRFPLLHALKTINLATSLISLVLTQAAILSFTNDVQNPSSNGILGVLMGVCAALLGMYMLRRMRRIMNPVDCRREQRLLNRMTKKHFPEYSLITVEKEFTDRGREVVWVRSAIPMEPELWEQICAEAEKRCCFQLKKTEKA